MIYLKQKWNKGKCECESKETITQDASKENFSWILKHELPGVMNRVRLINVQIFNLTYTKHTIHNQLIKCEDNPL